MPKRPTSQYICQQCGTGYTKWAGRCDNCGAWNSLIEQSAQIVGSTIVATSRGRLLKPQLVSKMASSDTLIRLTSGISEVDLVLGDGIVPGSVILLAGQPGIGKSTLLMQISQAVSRSDPVLYVSGEESAEQVKARADRLGTDHPLLHVISATSADDIAATIQASDYRLVVIDSIQTLALAELSAAAGSVSQITNATTLLSRSAKTTNTALIIVGHVTKEGSIAGPKILEHMVDVVLQLDGDRYGGFKVLRATKNRYGSTNEVGIFEMNSSGLISVPNPSASLLSERLSSDGSVVFATMEGNRPLLVEIQALVNKTNFGYPKRGVSGFDSNRLSLLIAVLERRTKLNLSDSDIYINTVGGIKLQDPAADLAVCMAIASAAKQMQLDSGAVVFGEVGLSGEVRSVIHSDRRIAEAKKLGFNYAICPKSKIIDSFLRPVSSMRDALITHLQ
ncbi:MAG TPA: DNA repair protein RadA [Patescibacteria group bacterium]|jgi:DNA repair protein RadA/Sms|nr:DNA repair protein RadA [Patescibacteria group bacterium]